MFLNNYARLTGRISQEVRIFENANGSKKVKFNLAVPREYTMTADDGSKIRPTDFIGVEKFLKADANDALYQSLTVGEKVSVEGRLRHNDYTAKDGHEVHELVFEISAISREESREVVEARAAAKGAAPAEEVEPEVL